MELPQADRKFAAPPASAVPKLGESNNLKEPIGT
jgi:hypothetical protein